MAFTSYLHACLLPGIIQDAMCTWYRLPAESNGCLVNTVAQQKFAWTMQIMVYDLPEALVILVYPLISYKTWTRRRDIVQPAGGEQVRMKSQQTRQAVSSTAEVKRGGEREEDD